MPDDHNQSGLGGWGSQYALTATAPSEGLIKSVLNDVRSDINTADLQLSEESRVAKAGEKFDMSSLQTWSHLQLYLCSTNAKEVGARLPQFSADCISCHQSVAKEEEMQLDKVLEECDSEVFLLQQKLHAVEHKKQQAKESLLAVKRTQQQLDKLYLIALVHAHS